MYVRSLVGAYAGEVRDYPVPVARQLLADGRAEPVTGAAPAEAPPDEPPAAPAKPKGRRKKKWRVR